jgi:hypothetical protein
MLKVLFQIILFFLIFRLLVPVFKGVGRLFGSSSPKTRPRNTSQRGNQPASSEPDYSELSPYEIEDAEFEEIKQEKGPH